MLFKKGQRYSATIRLGMLESLAGNEIIKGKLADAGFSDIVVTGTGRERSATGLWPGETQEADMPSQVENVKAI